LPFEPNAGVNLARDLNSRQVARSSRSWPLETVTVQSKTRPEVSIRATNATVPCSPSRADLAGYPQIADPTADFVYARLQRTREEKPAG
jgi:hypothetical protein